MLLVQHQLCDYIKFTRFLGLWGISSIKIRLIVQCLWSTHCWISTSCDLLLHDYLWLPPIVSNLATTQNKYNLSFSWQSFQRVVVTIATISPHPILPTPSFLLSKYKHLSSFSLSSSPSLFFFSLSILENYHFSYAFKTKSPNLSMILVGGRTKPGQMAGDSYLPQSRFFTPNNALAEVNFGGIYCWLMLSLQCKASLTHH